MKVYSFEMVCHHLKHSRSFQLICGVHFRYPFVITIEEDLSRSNSSTVECDRLIVKDKGGFRFE